MVKKTKKEMVIKISFNDEVGYEESVSLKYNHVYTMGKDFKKIKEFASTIWSEHND